MSLASLLPSAPAAPTPSPEQLAQQKANALAGLAKNLAQRAKQALDQFNRAIGNGSALSPTAVAFLTAQYAAMGVPYTQVTNLQQYKMALAQLDRSNREGIAAIWASPLFTPVEAFAALSVNGAALVIGSADTTAFLATEYAALDVAYTPPALPEGVTLVLGQDGTVTIGAA